MKARLAIMMFLQYAIWGAWAPVLWPYLTTELGFSQTEAGWIFSLLWIACMLAPFTDNPAYTALLERKGLVEPES